MNGISSSVRCFKSLNSFSKSISLALLSCDDYSLGVLSTIVGNLDGLLTESFLYGVIDWFARSEAGTFKFPLDRSLRSDRCSNAFLDYFLYDILLLLVVQYEFTIITIS